MLLRMAWDSAAESDRERHSRGVLEVSMGMGHPWASKDKGVSGALYGTGCQVSIERHVPNRFWLGDTIFWGVGSHIP